MVVCGCYLHKSVCKASLEIRTLTWNLLTKSLTFKRVARPLHRPRTQEAAEPSVGLGLELRTQCYQTNTHLSWGNLQYRSGLPSDTSFPYLPSNLSHVDTLIFAQPLISLV